MSLLVITKALSKSMKDVEKENEKEKDETGKRYNNKQAHVVLAEKMRKRDIHTAPNVGDRVPYVMVQGAKGARAYEKSEDPLWVLENNIPLDYEYYLENQLKKPLIRIFKSIVPDPASLLVGKHTRSISVPTPKKGGIVGFAVKKLSCVACKSPLQEGESTVCRQCEHKQAEIYQNQLNLVSNLEKQFARAWTQCQVCQGSLHQPVLCTSRDCPIFYMRKKVQKDLDDAQQMLSRFDISW
eukprot:TRINITY_DN5572_c0_g1_i1.p1 TRINITY_DN5572_c0_g1~~TRINITY_DN5572_c0_g1_i1.p1  ORF type:complete len:240 (+),score=52.66 TRINITY_DN5572_c0_g1_i1:263-982(+)